MTDDRYNQPPAPDCTRDVASYRRGCPCLDCLDAANTYSRERYAARHAPTRSDAHQALLAELNKHAAWMADAACAGMDPDVFHPDRGEDARPAKAICAACPVRQRCLDYALDARLKHGIWGGTSERERRRIRRTNRETAA